MVSSPLVPGGTGEEPGHEVLAATVSENESDDGSLVLSVWAKATLGSNGRKSEWEFSVLKVWTEVTLWPFWPRKGLDERTGERDSDTEIKRIQNKLIIR